MRTRLRWAALGVLALLAVVAAWTAVALVQARADLRDARGLLREVRDVDEAAQAGPLLARAEERLSDAEEGLRAPGPAVAARLPLAGRTVVAVREAAAAGAAVTAGAREVLDAVPDDVLVAGRVDLDGLAAVEAALRSAADRARRPVARLDAARTGLTPSVVADGVREARARLRDVPAALERAADGLAALDGVLGGDGDRRLLVVLQNNAELRATGGLVSVFAGATARDGALRVDGFQAVSEVADALPQVRQVPAPPDYRRLFEPFRAGTTLWKNVNMAADVPTSSAVLAEVAQASLSRRPDVVVWVDVPAIAALLRATGPVDLPDGSELTAGNAVRRLLSEAYAQADDQQERQQELRAAGDAVLGRLLSSGSPTSATALARALGPAVAGRHVALWSAQATEQALLERARLAGAVRADGGDVAALAVHNLGDGRGFGNKLDFYSRRQATVRVEVGRDEALVEHELALRNTAPASGLPVYVAGKVRPGVANSFVTLALPADAEVEAFARDGRRLRADLQPLADHAVLTDVVTLAPGATATWRLRYRLPLEDGRYRGRMVPQPLAVDGGLRLDVVPADGLHLRDGVVALSGPYDEVVHVDVVAERPAWWRRAAQAVRGFWSEPVGV